MTLKLFYVTCMWIENMKREGIAYNKIQSDILLYHNNNDLLVFQITKAKLLPLTQTLFYYENYRSKQITKKPQLLECVKARRKLKTIIATIRLQTPYGARCNMHLRRSKYVG